MFLIPCSFNGDAVDRESCCDADAGEEDCGAGFLANENVLPAARREKGDCEAATGGLCLSCRGLGCAWA